jgi:hypothetical protein
MDITYFLDPNNNKKDKKEDKNRKIKKELINYINKYTKLNKKDKKYINLLEHKFLIKFIKNNHSIININWFIDIINRINDNNIINLCSSIFSNLFKKDKIDNINFNKNNIITEINNIKYNKFSFTNEQNEAINNMINFIINYNKSIYGLYGYAGTGKTTTLTEFISFLLLNKYINSIVFTAPTNKAVNIMKSKMNHNIKLIYEHITGNTNINNLNIDDIIDKLADYKIIIHFITTHRLLNYKNDFNIDGERIFIRGGKSAISDYELVIIDECSMIPLQIIDHLIEDINNNNINSGENYKKKTKIIFSGDPAQLPPVNEKSSSIFINNKDDLNYDIYKKIIKNNNNFDSRVKFNKLIKTILDMDKFILKNVVRSRIQNVVSICYHIREWVENIIMYPKLNKFIIGEMKNKGVYLYKIKEKQKKTDTKWFKKFITYQNDISCNHNLGNIILTWTNNQTKEYNNKIRNIMFKGKSKIEKYEIGDVLMLNDFYKLDEVYVHNNDSKNIFYTSEQIKIMDKKVITKKSDNFSENITKTLVKMRNSIHIIKKYKDLIKQLNKKTKREYKVWKLTVQKLSESNIKNTIPELYNIYVIHYISKEELGRDKEVSLNLIKKFRQTLNSEFKNQIKTLDRIIIKQIWRQWNKIFISPFAQVSYGNSHSVHKSQGSSFYNVFVDTDDILNNNNIDEAKRCIYTAFTRTSNELHILIS